MLRRQAEKASLEEEIKELQSRFAKRRSPSEIERRLLIVANRLPMTYSRDKESGEFSFRMSSGGLVSALRGVRGFSMYWIGWPGGDVAESDKEKAKEMLMKDQCVPVFLSQHTIDLYYNGFSNNVLWPLFHYIAPPMEEGVAETSEEQWNAYKSANESFCDAILDTYQDGDLVWIHDYHLMLVPQLLRARRPDIRCGWFLHTPFPSSELYRMLPYRTEILRGVLAANLVGFHVFDYQRHFQNACTRILGVESTSKGIDAVELAGTFVTCNSFPIGIDPEAFEKALKTDNVKKHIADLEASFGDRKVILGIDRLDYIKGIPHKLLGFRKFLQDNPDWRQRCVLVQLAVPSRTDVPEYQRLRAHVHEMVGRINGKYGGLDFVPIHYLDQSLDFEKLVALYAVSDVALITSLRDGMNLVSYEYVASQKSKHGVLVLSEFAGAAQSLGASAIRVNPWNINELAAGIEEALNMSPEEREERHRYAYHHVTTYTAQRWAERFVSELKEASMDIEEARAAVPPPVNMDEVCHKFAGGSRRLIVLGFLGTMIPSRTKNMPLHHFQRLLSIPQPVLEALRVLGNDPNTTVLVVSSHERQLLERTLGSLPVWLAAENGYQFRPGGPGTEWTLLHEHLDLEWMDGVMDVVNYFVERTPASFVEKTATRIAWHYKDSLPDFGAMQAKDLLVHLWAGPLTNAHAEVVVGAKSVEVRPVGVNKAALVDRLQSTIWGSEGAPFDFVLCVGNFLWKDEDVYAALCRAAAQTPSPAKNVDRHVFAGTVGKKVSRANFYVQDPSDVSRLLNRLSKLAHSDVQQ